MFFPSFLAALRAAKAIRPNPTRMPSLGLSPSTWGKCFTDINLENGHQSIVTNRYGHQSIFYQIALLWEIAEYNFILLPKALDSKAERAV
jgi:hypothetical protein